MCGTGCGVTGCDLVCDCCVCGGAVVGIGDGSWFADVTEYAGCGRAGCECD